MKQWQEGPGTHFSDSQRRTPCRGHPGGDGAPELQALLCHRPPFALPDPLLSDRDQRAPLKLPVYTAHDRPNRRTC